MRKQSAAKGKKKAVSRAVAAPDNLIFALDIGTRSIIGVVGVPQGDKFKILATETIEHEKRAMIDGQIEDISEVAAVASRVTASLQKQLGFKLHRVCVAAAGRALKTNSAEYVKDFSERTTITREAAYELEMGAVERASEPFCGSDLKSEQNQFYCVGHTVKRYYLDDYPYSTIIGHKGQRAKVEIIATFLPSEVVESLSAAMGECGLEIEFMTLEPIAAMNAVIPKELRLLNLALVDIGAGTSDIAVCEDNCVTAYTMATVAGDEITEELIRRCLVDFDTAEQIKHRLGGDEEKITYSDIVGVEYSVDKNELLQQVLPSVATLAEVICERILDCNAKPPAAVFLVGGGSQVPGLCELVAQKLGIDKLKVAVGGNNFMKRVVIANQDISGPQYATPVGIAVTAGAAGEQRGFSITVNGKKQLLFRGSVMPIMDVLLLSGYKYADILGKNGKPVEYELNGKRVTVRGERLSPATVTVNGVPAGITTPVRSGDEVTIAPARCGKDATLRLSQAVPDRFEIAVSLNGQPTFAGRWASVNGKKVSGDTLIENGDIVKITEIATAAQLAEHAGIFGVALQYIINGRAVSPDAPLKEGDVILISASDVKSAVIGQSPDAAEKPVANEIKTVLSAEDIAKALEKDAAPNSEQAPPAAQQAPAAVSGSGSAIPPPADEAAKKEGAVSQQEPAAPPVRVRINGEEHLLPPKPNGDPYQFLEMLTLVDIDPSKPQGDIVLLHNGTSASYLQKVVSGDEIKIFWSGK